MLKGQNRGRGRKYGRRRRNFPDKKKRKAPLQKAHIDTQKCKGCGICVSACPFMAISMVQNIARIDPEKCRGCGICVQHCPRNAISLQQRE